MIELQADVSGADILNHGYSIVVCDISGKFHAGFKFDRKLISVIKKRYREGKYRYQKSKEGKSYLRIRLYCIALAYLIKMVVQSLPKKSISFSLHACRDFYNHGHTIKINLRGILKELKMVQFRYDKIPNGAPADELAFQLHKGITKIQKSKLKFDPKNEIKLKIEDFEKYLT